MATRRMAAGAAILIGVLAGCAGFGPFREEAPIWQPEESPYRPGPRLPWPRLEPPPGGIAFLPMPRAPYMAGDRGFAALYLQQGGRRDLNGGSYFTDRNDTCAAAVAAGGVLGLESVVFRTAGSTSSFDASSWYGLNAGLLAQGGSAVRMEGGSVVTEGDGAHGVFVNGAATLVTLEDAAAGSRGRGSHAVMAVQGGTVVLRNARLKAAGAGCAAAAVGRGAGTVRMQGGSAEAAGPAFLVEGGKADIALSGVDVVSGSGVLLRVTAGPWAAPGSGGGAALRARGQELHGDCTADPASSLLLVLDGGSVFEGSVNADGKAAAAGLVLGEGCVWKVTTDSRLTELSVVDGEAGLIRIESGGHAVLYDASRNAWLEGKTCALSGGGSLTPYGGG